MLLRPLTGAGSICSMDPREYKGFTRSTRSLSHTRLSAIFVIVSDPPAVQSVLDQIIPIVPFPKPPGVRSSMAADSRKNIPPERMERINSQLFAACDFSGLEQNREK